jgi:uncharacterized protein (DUF1499 family)
MKLNATLAQRIALFGLLLGIVSVVLVAGAGPGSRFGLWHFRVSFLLLRFAVYGGIGAILVSIPAAVMCARKHVAIFPSLVAIVLGAVSVGFPVRMMQVARSVPPIHDITTDTDHPPEFVAVVALRGPDSNPLEYGGAKVAEQQKSAYPDVAPLVLPLPQAQAWEKARGAAEKMGWTIDATDQPSGRIEATATTAWFGFKDDVVVRVMSTDADHSRVDVRSVSRVGTSDLGANAARIRKYLAALRE